jgi:hypothetical protein
VPSKYLESADAYAQMAGVAQALGVDRIRVALLYGRRYESFATLDAWSAHDRKWRSQLAAIKPAIERYPILVGIENHKDFTSHELAELLTSLDSAKIGACVDFGNNISLLEDSARHGPHAGAVCRDHASQGHGGAAIARRLRTLGSAARRGPRAVSRGRRAREGRASRCAAGARDDHPRPAVRSPTGPTSTGSP